MKVKMKNFKERLSKKCPKCKPQSIAVYARSARRLFRLTDPKSDLPENTAWLKTEKLKKAYEKVPLAKRRHLSVAAHQFFKAHGKVDSYWQGRMFTDSDAYSRERSKNKKSATEQKNWVDNALGKLKKISTEFKRSINHKLRKEPSVKHLWLYTQYLILRFYSEHQLRNDLATVKLKSSSKSDNILKRVKGSRYDLHMNSFKASDKIGSRVIHISRALSNVLYQYIQYRNRVAVKHDNLLSNIDGKVLSKMGLGRILRKMTADKLGKTIGTRMLRIFNATRHAKLLEKAAQVSHGMLHSAKQTKEYVRK